MLRGNEPIFWSLALASTIASLLGSARMIADRTLEARCARALAYLEARIIRQSA